MIDACESLTRRWSPVYGERLGARSNNHSDEFLGVPQGEPYLFIEDLDMALFIHSPDKPNLPSIKGQRMPPPKIWWQKSQIGFDDSRRSLTVQALLEVGGVGVLESQGTPLQLPQRPKPIPLPDFFLPQAVVALDASVGGRASLGGKDGNHSTGQAQSNHLPQPARMHVPARQAHIVVHLQKSRHPMVLPISDQKSQDPLHPTVGLHRPTDQACRHILRFRMTTGRWEDR